MEIRYVFKIDKDNKIVFDEFVEDWKKVTKLILKSFGLKVVDIVIKPSPSKKGYHIWVHAIGSKKLKDEDFVKIQYLLGDDETRSYLALMRIKRGVEHWNKLFSKVVWKRKEDYKFKKCMEILNKKKISEEERKYVSDYLERMFLSLKDLTNKITKIGEECG